ncbi:hypothetical protein ACHAWF_004048, partial [Thalassiosira exigua]
HEAQSIYSRAAPQWHLVSDRGYTHTWVQSLPLNSCGHDLTPVLEEHYKPQYDNNASIVDINYERRASNVDLIKFQEMLGYDAQGLDILGWKLWREAASTPDAKIIFTEHPRGAEAWAKSFTSGLIPLWQRIHRPPFTLMNSFAQLTKVLDENLSYFASLATECKDCPNSPYDPLFSYPGSDLVPAYEKHKQSVVAAVPEGRLLIFDPTQGWKPLCDFLEVDVCPIGEYPRVYDRQMLQTTTNLAMLLNWAWYGLLLLSIVVLGVFGRRVYTIRLKAKKKTD